MPDHPPIERPQQFEERQGNQTTKSVAASDASSKATPRTRRFFDLFSRRGRQRTRSGNDAIQDSAQSMGDNKEYLGKNRVAAPPQIPKINSRSTSIMDGMDAMSERSITSQKPLSSRKTTPAPPTSVKYAQRQTSAPVASYHDGRGSSSSRRFATPTIPETGPSEPSSRLSQDHRARDSSNYLNVQPQLQRPYSPPNQHHIQSHNRSHSFPSSPSNKRPGSPFSGAIPQDEGASGTRDGGRRKRSEDSLRSLRSNSPTGTERRPSAASFKSSSSTDRK